MLYPTCYRPLYYMFCFSFLFYIPFRCTVTTEFYLLHIISVWMSSLYELFCIDFLEVHPVREIVCRTTVNCY